MKTSFYTTFTPEILSPAPVFLHSLLPVNLGFCDFVPTQALVFTRPLSEDNKLVKHFLNQMTQVFGQAEKAPLQSQQSEALE